MSPQHRPLVGIRCDEIWSARSCSCVPVGRVGRSKSTLGSISALDTARAGTRPHLFLGEHHAATAGHRRRSGFCHAFAEASATRRCTAPIRANSEWTPHCPHIQHLRHRRRPDGSARGDEKVVAAGAATFVNGEQLRRTFCWVEDIVDELVRRWTPADRDRGRSISAAAEVFVVLAEKIAIA